MIDYTCVNFRKSRKTFDTTETRKDLGPFIIEYGKVQSKVALKYDSWHKEILNKFGGLLGNSMTEFHVQVAKVGSNAMNLKKIFYNNKLTILVSK